MAESYAFSEGSAYFYTGAGGQSALATFARNVSVTLRREWHTYRPPHNNTYQRHEIGRAATLSIGQVFSQKDLQNFFQSASAGVHVHLKHAIGAVGTTGGVILYSGALESVTLGGSEGQLMELSVAGQFNEWSVY